MIEVLFLLRVVNIIMSILALIPASTLITHLVLYRPANLTLTRAKNSLLILLISFSATASVATSLLVSFFLFGPGEELSRSLFINTGLLIMNSGFLTASLLFLIIQRSDERSR